MSSICNSLIYFQENFTARYRSSTQIEHGRPVPLNPDHTHFIFVDDGYRSRYGGVAEFRSEFEKKISQAKEGDQILDLDCHSHKYFHCLSMAQLLNNFFFIWFC